MRVHQVAQGSPEWLELRLGVPTASEFHRVVTPGGKFSAQSRPYAIRLVTEWLLHAQLDSIEALDWVARGSELEPAAAASYEFQTETRTELVGFVTTDDGRLGASPDRLVGAAGLLEIKCPAPQTHMGYLLASLAAPGDARGLGADEKYKPQVQGQLLVAEREWCDLISYHPELPDALIRTHRDEPYLALLRAALEQFLDLRDTLLEQAQAAGAYDRRPAVRTAHDERAEDLGPAEIWAGRVDLERRAQVELDAWG